MPLSGGRALDTDRSFNRLENLLIAGAAAQIAGERIADLIPRRMWMLVEQRLRGHQDARRAIAALRGAEIRERFLQRMQSSIRDEPFHGHHASPVTLDAEHEAREHRLIVEQHGAGAALPELAAMFRAAQVQVFTEHLEERFVRSERDFGRLAVDGQRDVRVWHRHRHVA